MTLRHRVVSVGAIALALTASACSSNDAEEPTPTTEPTSDHQPLPSPDDATSIGTGDADLKDVTSSDAQVDKRTFIGPLTMTPDGQMVVGVTRRNPKNPLNLIRDDLALMDPESGELEYLSSGSQSVGIQIAGAVATKRWIVWTTTPSTSMGLDPWTLYSYNRRTGTSHELGTAPTLPNGRAPRTSDYSSPSIAGGRVYLTGASSVQNRDTIETSVYSAALNGAGGLREDFPGEQFPIASSDSIVTVRHAADGSIQLVERSTHRRAGEATIIVEGTRITELAHAGNAVAWAEKRNGRHTIHLKIGRDDAQDVIMLGREPTELSMTEERLQFKIRQTAYWYDLDTAALFELDQRGVYLPTSGFGDYIVWKPYSLPNGESGEIYVARLDPE